MIFICMNYRITEYATLYRTKTNLIKTEIGCRGKKNYPEIQLAFIQKQAENDVGGESVG